MRKVAVLFAAVALLVPSAAIADPTIPGDTGAFHADCAFSHRALDDPIVFPGQPGASHSHDFEGNTSTNAFSTNASLRSAGTNCFRDDEVFKYQQPPEPQADRSAYWVPTLYVNDQAVAPSAGAAAAYYTTGRRLPGTIETFPQDYKIIAGNAAGGPSQINGIRVWRYSCIGATVAPGTATTAPTCDSDGLKLEMKFPDCWDGINVDSPNHRSHAVYSIDGSPRYCPASHPVALPALRFALKYPTTGGPTTRVASGDLTTSHTDFMNGWDSDELDHLVEVCLNADEYCGGTDGPAN
jgi:hypothetical protein